jgi:16S rRNA (cytosine1402-N4)-methyltransferase
VFFLFLSTKYVQIFDNFYVETVFAFEIDLLLWHNINGKTCRKTELIFYPKFFLTYSQVFHIFVDKVFSMNFLPSSPSVSSSSQDASDIHVSVLRDECADILNISGRTCCIDATLGLGGHTHYFCEQNPHLQVFGFDQDENARKKATERLEQYSERVEIIPQNFENIEKVCQEKNISPDSILFDIGVSSLQFDTPDRGFSFRFDAKLDMRMNQSDGLTAEEIVNTWSAEELEKIFLEYGEESWGRHIAKKICEEREKKPFVSTLELSDFIARVKPTKKVGKNSGKNGGGHPAALVFQALRIAVNRELEVLEKALHGAIRVLAPGGRIAVITFHSLEDRIVKNIFASYEQKGKKQKYPKPSESTNAVEKISGENKIFLEKIHKKPLIPSPREIAQNPRSRSAKLRCVQKML